MTHLNERHAHLPKESFLGEQRNAEYCSLSSEGAEVSHTCLISSFGRAKDQIKKILILWFFNLKAQENTAIVPYFSLGIGAPK